MDGSRILYVRGIGGTISKEELTIYFQSPKQSGGGDISSIDLNGDEAVITFEDDHVAKNVGSRTHTINGTQVNVSFYPSTRETQSQEISADQTWVIIRGLSKNTTEGALLNYFENTRRSGGGPVEEVNIKGDWARIKFESSEVAKCVVEREKHTLNDATLDVSFEMPNRQDENTKTIEVAGLPRTTTTDSILNYFENKRRSGGGEVETVDLRHKAGVAFVTFKDIGVAKNVGSRKHIINGTRVDVSFHPSTRETQSQETSADQVLKCLLGLYTAKTKTKKIAETWVIIGGLSKNTTEGALLNYFENTRRSGGGPVEEVNIKGDWARIKFESSEVAKCVVEREKHTLNDATLDVSFEMPNRQDENTKTIEVAGLPRTTTKDSILNYFENKRRSGGGEVETVDLRHKAGVAFVTFKDIGVAKNVGSRKHIINGTRVDVSFHPSTRETQSQETSADQTWVIIRGLSENTTEDALLNYFENTRRSGGGPVEEVNIKGVCARIKFESAEVAKCVVEREKHTLNDATLDVSFEMCDRRDENTKTIEVTGFPGSTTKDSILNYFENKRRSGGGEVENVNLRHEAGVAFVTFKDIGVVNTVLQKDKHVLDGATLKVTASNNTRCSSDREETQESRAIEVRGLATTSTKDSISMFFENTRRSGGGEVEHVDYTPEQGIAVVTFVKAESAVGVVNKGALTLDDAELKITIRKPVKELPIDTKRLLVKGLSDKTTRDGLQSYMEVVSRVEVLSIEFGEQGSAAVIFGKTYDYQTITQRVAKRQLEGQQLSIEQVPVCNCVLVTGLNRENTTEDAVLYHFENSKNGGGDVTNVELNIKEGWALVHFEDPEVVTKVLSKSHTLNEAKLEVSLHSPFLGKPLSQLGTQEGELVASIPVDSQLMLFICERHEADFKKIQDDHGITITWEEGAGSIMVKPSDKTSSDRKKFEEACEVIASFMQEFQTATSRVLPEAWEAVLDIFLKNASAMEEKVLVHCVTQQHVISLTGKKQDVEGLRNDLQELKTRIERKVKLEASIETKSIDIDNTVRLQFLRDLDFGKELEAAYEVTQVSILLETGKVQIRAPPNTFHKVSAMIWETIAKVTEISLEMSQKAVEILRSTACRAFINDTFTANNLQASLAFDSARKDSVIVMGMNTEAAEKASILIKRLVVEECVDLDEDQVQLEKSEKWSQLRYDLTEKRILSLSFDRRNKKMWLVGTKDDVSFALAAVTRFLKENTIVSNVVKLPTGCRRFLAKYREQELRQIEEDLKEHSTRIKRVTDEEDEDLVISGTTDGVEKGTKLVQDLAAKVRNEKFFLNKPGMRKVLGQSKGKKMLTLLENENKCVIEHYISEKYESHSKKSGEEKEENKKELCSYLTPEGKNILVFKDNICDRNVDVIVNAANCTLYHVGGVSKAIVEAAGKDVKDECDQYIVDHGPLLDGHVVTTSAGKLPFMKVIHAVGPKWTKEAAREKRMGRSPRQENLLSYAVKNALDSAQSYKSIALPAISTGVYDFPYQLCAKIMVDTAVVFFQENPGCRLSEIQFTSTDDDVVKAFVKEMDSRFLHDPNYESSSDTKVKGKARKVKGRKKTIPSTPSTASPADIPNAIKTPEDLKLILVTGNMSQEKVDVIVNSASSDLDLSKNASAKALSNAAGPTLQQECKAIGKVNIGDIVITSGGNLNCKHVFHTSCATWNQQSGEQELRAIIKKCLNEAQKRSLVSIAIPALGTGNLGYPRDRVAAASFDEVLAFSKNNAGSTLREVHLVVYDKDTPSVKAFREELQTRKGSQPGMPPSAATGSEKKKRGRAHGVTIKSSDPDDLDASNDAFEMVDEELDHTKPEIAMGAITVQAETGDITKEDTDAIAILSNNQLSVGGGVGIAILNAGGPTIQQECSSLGFQSSGSVAVTGAGKLNVKNIYHMVPDTMHSMRSIKDCIVNCLRKADSSGLTSLSFPAIGTGNIGKDVKEAAEGMLLAISKFAQEQPKSISFIRIVIYEPPMLKVFRSAMEACIRSSVEGDPGVISKIAGWLGLGKSGSTTSYAIASKKMLSTKGDSYLEIFAGSKQHIDKVIKDIERDVADHFKQKVIVHDAIGKLSKQQTRKIRDLQAEHDVLVTIEEAIGRISIRGDVEGVLDVATTIHEILNQQMEEDYTRGVEELLAKNIQWYFRDDDGSWEPYDTSINLQIENAFNDGQDTVMVLIDDVRCEIVFKDMKETSSEDGEERVVVRKEFGKGIPLPNEWEVHPKDSSGKEEEVLLVPLDPVTHAIEYKKIADEVAKTSPVTITKIQRVQNPTQYRVYMVRKDQMEQKKGSNEQALFHGTAESSCASINKTGFNRSYCGKNAVVYGNGVYFARDASYSTQTKYSPPDAAGNRHMYLARVLVGEYTTGRQGMITPPPKGSDATDTYDTVVDNPGNPTIFVVFYDNQCYPDYLITFK